MRWLAGLVATAILVGPAVAATNTVSNTATFSFQSDATSPVQSIASNHLTFDYVSRVPAPTPSSVEFLNSAASGTSSVAAEGTQCQGATGSFAPSSAPTRAGRVIDPAAVFLQPAVSMHAGDAIFVRLTDGNRNLDSTVRDTVDVRLTTSGGDEEIVRLQETGPDTGVFAGYVQTVASSTSPARFDCRLTVAPNTTITAQYVDAIYPTDTSQTSALVDPFGVVFDSSTGSPIDGVVVTIVDAATGQPATVVGDDGLSRYPSAVTTGAAVTDASGRTYPAVAGGFRFPSLAPGDYVLKVASPAGYAAPSSVSPATLNALRTTAGTSYVIGAGSFGARFTVAAGGTVRFDIPIDPVSTSLVVQKLASVAFATAGDFVQYQLTVQNRSATRPASRAVIVDRLPAGLRYKAGSLRLAGKAIANPAIGPDGRTLTIAIGDLPAGATTSLTYVLQVIAGAPPGDAVNSASAIVAGLPASNVASVAVKIRPPLFSEQFTIIGRVLDGACSADPASLKGVAGVRLLLDDGHYVVTDRDGQYHFEGVRPGTHVVQIDVDALERGGLGLEAAPCIRNTRFAGRAFSQFVEGFGGSLQRADFHVRRKAPTSESDATPIIGAPDSATIARRGIVDDVTAAGGDGRWPGEQGSAIAWLFPRANHNPRAPAQRIAIRHGPAQTVRLTSGGKPVGALTFDGTESSADHASSISVWRGLPLVDGDNRFEAEIVAADGTVVERLVRDVHFANAPARVEFVPAQSTLVADGLAKPVVAVRLVDRQGFPVHAGVTGPFRVNAPYTAALAIELQQSRQLAGLERNPLQYKVEGDDGIAYVELAPTTESGSVLLQFDFDRGPAGSQSRLQEVRSWLKPAERDWVVVGFARGTIGYDHLSRHLEPLAEGGDRAPVDGVERSGQISLYAKGRVLGDWLLTLAYDSTKPAAERQRQSLLGVIDPRQFYTLYGDASQQRADAASATRLYLKLEREQFYALFGDFESGLTQSKLARYSRTINGIKTEYRADGISFIGFATDSAQGYGRDEIAGNGTSGLYRLSQSDILINSDRVRIETRDRFRSDVIVDTRALTRFIDYDIDYAAGTLFFREPVESRDVNLNPRFIVAEYETEGNGTKRVSAGGRAAIEWLDGRVTTGVSALRDANASNTSELVGLDAKVKLRPDTELRLETARSRSSRPVSALTSAGSGSAHLVELEHNDERFAGLAYFRREGAGFGINQQNAIELGTSKFGLDARYQLEPQTTLIGQAYRLTSLANNAQREAGTAQLEYRILPWTLRVGAIVADDVASDGTRTQSRQATVGALRSFLDGRLEVFAEANVSVAGKNASTDYPSRFTVGAAYALTDRWKLVAAEEYAVASTFRALTTRFGFQSDPWTGARLSSTINQSSISEYGPRTFGVLGLKQSLPIGEHLTIDVAGDGSRTFRGDGPAASSTSGALVAQGALGSTTQSAFSSYGSASNVGALGGAGTYGSGVGTAGTIAALTENFTAVSVGATWREDLWSWTGRAEDRNGQLASRRGLTTGFLRQADAGVAFAAQAQVFEVAQANGVRGVLARADLSWAYRPLGTRWSMLDKFEVKRDALANGSGSYDGKLFGGTSLASAGNARSTRLVNNFALNGIGKAWTEKDTEGNLFDLQQRNQWGLYYGAKYVVDRFDDADYRGFTDLIGAEARFDLTSRYDLGVRFNRLHAWSSHTTAYSVGPSVGWTPLVNAWISLGFNVRGFKDRDFGATNYTARGPFVTLRFKFDQSTGRGDFAGANRPGDS